MATQRTAALLILSLAIVAGCERGDRRAQPCTLDEVRSAFERHQVDTGGPIVRLVEPEEVTDTPFAASLGPPIAVLVFADSGGAEKRMQFIEKLPRQGRVIRHNNVLVLEEKRNSAHLARAKAALESLDC